MSNSLIILRGRILPVCAYSYNKGEWTAACELLSGFRHMQDGCLTNVYYYAVTYDICSFIYLFFYLFSHTICASFPFVHHAEGIMLFLGTYQINK